MIKIAFLFLTISSIVHEKVWQDFFNGHDEQYSIYIHAKEVFDIKSAFKKYEMATKIPTKWGRLMLAEIALLKEALQDPLNNKFIFVSGDSVPIQHFDYVYQQVLQHPLSIIPYWWNHHQDTNSPHYMPHRILHGIPADKQFKNSQWIILNRKHAELMVQDQSIIKTIVEGPAEIDDEHYPSTFLAMHNLLHEVVNQATTLVVWPKTQPHPLTFKNMSDRYESQLLIEAMNHGILFARKFDQKCDMLKLQSMVNKYAQK